MLNFKSFIKEADDFTERNKAIDLEGIVKSIFQKKGVTDPKAAADVIAFLSTKKVFSLDKLVDEFSYSVGVLKAVIDAVKEAIKDKGYGKTGSNVSGPLS